MHDIPKHHTEYKNKANGSYKKRRKENVKMYKLYIPKMYNILQDVKYAVLSG